MKNLFLLSTLVLPLFANASEPGFSSGNSFTATLLRGNIQVQCNEAGHLNFGNFSCESETLDPAEFVHFVGPKNLDADEVHLLATHADKSTAKSSVGYDSLKGISTDYVNLWISTLLQTPLLDYGSNSVEYTLKKADTVIQKGVFTATVKTGSERDCKTIGFYVSYNASDCISGGNLCERYFAEQNYCQ